MTPNVNRSYAQPYSKWFDQPPRTGLSPTSRKNQQAVIGDREDVVDYICYISRTKVDSLHAQLDPERSSEFTEQVISEQSGVRDLRMGLSLGNILSLFNGGLTYGRKNVIQRERTVKLAYIDKLRDVLLTIAADHGDVPDIREAISSGQSGTYYFYDGPFRIEIPVENPTSADIVTLRSSFCGRTLLLDCSLRFFSEGPEPDGTFLLHSGNYRFFAGQLQMRMSTVFALLGVQGTDVVGTPLYLQLSSANLSPGAAL